MKSENKPILITGDFNMEPDSKEFKAMKQTWRLLSDPTLETYPSDHPRLRLDYIFGDLKHEFRIINDQVIDHPVVRSPADLYRRAILSFLPGHPQNPEQYESRNS